MRNEVIIKGRILHLAATYMKMNEEGRNILELFIHKLTELPKVPENTIVHVRRKRK